MVESTHAVMLGVDRVEKRYLSWDRDEPAREWDALTRLHRTVPGLAPRPMSHHLDGAHPVLVMSRVPGEPLGRESLTARQVAALGLCLRRLHTALPAAELEHVPERISGPREMLEHLRGWILQDHAEVDPPVRQALTGAQVWLAGGAAEKLVRATRDRVFTHGDGNIGNFLWDGHSCHVVDFEDSGVSDPAYEIADLVEHLTVWLPGLIDVDLLVRALEFTDELQERLQQFRKLLAVFWLLMLLPGNRAHDRNPPGTLERQALRVLLLLA
jgi:Ser/Thr protein kinase RdoA (MazF antagonist)